MAKGDKKDLKNKYFLSLALIKEERAQKITTLVLTFIALSFFGFFAINPTLSTITKLKKELQDLQFVNGKLKEKIANLGLLQQQYLTIQNDIPYILSAIPQTPRIPYFVGQIQAVAASDQVTITNFQVFQVDVVTAIKVSDKRDFTFSLNAVGTNQHIIHFIDDLNTMERIVTFDSVSLNNDPTQNTVSLSIKGATYFKQ